MKSKWTLLPAALLLAFALTACGGGMNQGDGQTNGGGQTGSAVTGGPNNSVGNQNGDGFTDGQNGSVGDDLVRDARDALTGANDLVEDAMDGGAVRQARRGANSDQMIQNGRVHDRDGDLTDLENSVTPGSTTF